LKADGPCFNNTIDDPNGYNRYQDCGNGTVTDTVTGLIWLQNANCFGYIQWAAANTSAANLQHGDCGGFLTDNSSPGDWRLPTKEEWEATVAQARARACTFPALTDTTGSGCYRSGVLQPSFVGIQSSGYWSSTTNVPNASGAWVSYVYYDGGMEVYSKTATTSVWPVRGGR
jgi:hypothetical protein